MTLLQSSRCGGLVLAVTLATATAAFAQRIGPRPPGRPSAEGQTITARDGDVVVVKPNSDVRLIRRGDANVRAIYDPAKQTVLWLVDYVGWDGHEPDNRVDMAYRFEGVTGNWPLGERWEGRAVVEDYSLIGTMLAGHGAGLSTPAGLIQLISTIGPGAAELFKDKAAVATLTYRGGGRGTTGEVPFDVAEAREKESMAQNAESRRSFAAGGVTLYPPPQAPVRVGGNIKTPAQVHHVAAVLPAVARHAGITGAVLIEATIGPDGAVKDAKILRSIPLLDGAALEAVRQWRYEPTLLNGAPVSVIMTVVVPVQ